MTTVAAIADVPSLRAWLGRGSRADGRTDGRAGTRAGARTRLALVDTAAGALTAMEELLARTEAAAESARAARDATGPAARSLDEAPTDLAALANTRYEGCAVFGGANGDALVHDTAGWHYAGRAPYPSDDTGAPLVPDLRLAFGMFGDEPDVLVLLRSLSRHVTAARWSRVPAVLAALRLRRFALATALAEVRETRLRLSLAEEDAAQAREPADPLAAEFAALDEQMHTLAEYSGYRIAAQAAHGALPGSLAAFLG